MVTPGMRRNWRSAALAALAGIMWAFSVDARAMSADISPDGKQILATWSPRGESGRDLVIVDVASGSIRVIGPTTDSGGALWSPDGNWIVYQGADGGDLVTRIYDVRQGSSRTVSRQFGPPYAWREDSRRLAGVAHDEDVGLQVVFYNLSERGESLRTNIPVRQVRSMAWIPNTDDVAYLGTSDSGTDVYTVEGGEGRRISTSGDVLTLRLVRSRNELVWARSSKNTRYILLSLYAYDLKARSVRRMGFPERVAEINPAPARSPVAVDDVVISPLGNRLAVVVADVKRGPGAATTRMQRLFTVRSNGSSARLVRTIPQAGPTNAMAPIWSRDGRQLGVLHREGSRLTLAVFGADGSGGRVVARSE